MVWYGANLVAVLAAAIASMVVGMVWYSPVLFGNTWMKAMGITPKKMEDMKKKGGSMTKAYGATFVAALVTAYVLAMFLNLTQSTTLLA